MVCGATLLASATPAAADPPAPATQMRSQGMVAGGVVLTVAGAAAATLGAVRFTSATLCTDVCANPQGNQVVGAVVLGAGLAVLAGGITLLVIGNQRVPVPSSQSAFGAPGGAGWMWRF